MLLDPNRVDVFVFIDFDFPLCVKWNTILNHGTVLASKN